MSRDGSRTPELGLILLIALHSLAVGICLLFFPAWSARFGGWGSVDAEFFIRQGGAFHIVVGIGYLHEYLRYRSVTLLVLAKSTAVLFLVATAVVDDGAAWAVPFSALGDGLMALVVVLVHRWARRRSGS